MQVTRVKRRAAKNATRRGYNRMVVRQTFSKPCIHGIVSLAGEYDTRFSVLRPRREERSVGGVEKYEKTTKKLEAVYS